MKVLFSSWEGNIVDNRGKPKEEWEDAPVKLPESVFGDKIRAFFGWAGIVVLDENQVIPDLARAYMEAVQKESCGKCIPCRVGTRIILDCLERICDGKGREEDLDLIVKLGTMIMEGSKCGIGQTGPKPVVDAVIHFRDSFLDLIKNKKVVDRGTYKISVTAPCMDACPSSLDIPKYIEAIYEGDFEKSLEIIRERTCLPATLGRVCVNPCEESCRRALVDGPLAIRWLKRFVADFEMKLGRFPKIEVLEKRPDKVAIIGAGPAGVSCAYYLAKMGYSVTIFERHPHPGGMALYGIPDYRLPREVLFREVSIVESLGVEIKYNVKVGKDIAIKDMFDQGYKAIFIGVGAQGSAKMGVEGEDAGYKGFIPGVKYLYEINSGRDPYPEGKRVVVVGGGNVAMDCVRCSFRIGKEDVHLVYRRTKAEMPANKVEIEEAEEEGVEFHYLCNPTRIIAENGKVVAVELIKMELGEPDESGRRRPVPIPGSEFILETDIVVPAIGQAIQLDFLEGFEGVKAGRGNRITVDPYTFETDIKGVFAAGDCVTGPNVLVRAAGSGRRAAEKIDQFLRGVGPVPTDEDRFDYIFGSLGLFNKEEKVPIPPTKPRHRMEVLPPEVRKYKFDEIEQGYSPEVAIDEASRCLRCYRIGLVSY